MMGANLIVVGMLLCVCRMKHLLIETEDSGDRDREPGDPGDRDREPGQDYSEDSYYYHDDYNAVMSNARFNETFQSEVPIIEKAEISLTKRNMFSSKGRKCPRISA